MTKTHEPQAPYKIAKYDVEDSIENAVEMLGDGRLTPKRKRSGSYEITNLVPVCKWCNISKSGKPLEIWRIKLAAKFGRSFTFEQRCYWILHGVKLPDDARFEFWFEQEGLK